jgi:probable LLM family oxidoreductase
MSDERATDRAQGPDATGGPAPTRPGAMEIGVYTFGELNSDPHTGATLSAQQRLANILAAAQLADAAGLDVFGVGEHHRLDFAVSATPVVLGAIAPATRRIRLTSAVTVLSTADPVRVFEDFATVDLLSAGRAEIIAGRGAFVESFPLFGYDLQDYDALFTEKVGLLLRLNAAPRVTWSGQFRPPLHEAEIAPRPAQPALPVWIGVGGTPQSALRAGGLGLPMMLAIIGGAPAQMAPLVGLYRRAGLAAGHAAAGLRVGVSSHCFVAPTSQEARDVFYPHYAHYFSALVPSNRGRRIARADFDHLAGPHGALFVGSPAEIVDKILYERELFGHTRFLAQLDIGGLPYPQVARAIELLAGDVAPAVRRATA